VVRSGSSSAAQLQEAALGVDAVVCELAGHEDEALAAVTALAHNAAAMRTQQRPLTTEATATAEMPAAAACRQRVFIAITSPLAWAATPPLPQVPGLAECSGTPAAEAAAAPADTRVGFGAGSAAGEGEDVAAGTPLPQPAYTERDAPARQPAAHGAAAYRAEVAILQAARPRLATHVLLPGLLYGRGEDDAHLHHVFKPAWEGGTLVQVGAGTNRLPTLHVGALGGYVAALLEASARALALGAQTAAAKGPIARRLLQRAAFNALDNGRSTDQQQQHSSAPSSAIGLRPNVSAPQWPPPLPPPYLVVADEVAVTQAQLLASAATAFGVGLAPRIERLSVEEALLGGGEQRGSGAWGTSAVCGAAGGAGGELFPLWGLLDLPLRTTALPVDPIPAPSCSPGGILDALDTIAAEMVAARGLAPVRILVRGPPASGKSHLAARLAWRYGLRLVTARTILAEAEACDADVQKVGEFDDSHCCWPPKQGRPPS
jgi:hypothetical protein